MKKQYIKPEASQFQVETDNIQVTSHFEDDDNFGEAKPINSTIDIWDDDEEQFYYEKK